MNLAILDFHPTEPTVRDLMERALEPNILIGMPHLTPTGLSETWLMKELGHRHWLLLALNMQMDNADFRTTTGEEAYAAICATSLADASLESIGANDILTIHSDLLSVSRTQVATRHCIRKGALAVAHVELISTFVHRTVAGDNHSIARLPLSPSSDGFEHNALAAAASGIRSGLVDLFAGTRVSTDTVLASFRFEPPASQEFNGAGLFYFAEFQALADRAFSHWFRSRQTAGEVVGRDVFFSGNIQQGEALAVELMDVDASRTSSHIRIRRADGKAIGRIFTRHADALDFPVNGQR
jgi:probable biosynthetic protein (TIGR04099 family)